MREQLNLFLQHFSPDCLQARHAKRAEHFYRQQISKILVVISNVDRSFAVAGPRMEQFAV